MAVSESNISGRERQTRALAFKVFAFGVPAVRPDTQRSHPASPNHHVVNERSVACLRLKQKAQAHSLLGGFSLDYCYTQQNFQATSRVSIPHHTTSNTESKPWKADSSTEILPHAVLCGRGTASDLRGAGRCSSQNAGKHKASTALRNLRR